MRGRSKILIVDDDRDDLDIAVRALDRQGMGPVVEVARDGHEALQLLGLENGTPAESIRPEVVFLDLKMPGIDGWEVLRRMREDEELADLPVVVLSSSDHDMDVRRSYELGANSFLVKRFDARGPGAYIVEAAQYWLDLNRPPPRRSMSS